MTHILSEMTFVGVTGHGALALAGLAAANVTLAELKPHTRAAFERYVRVTEARMAPELGGQAPFLWIDRHAPAERDAVLARLRRGEVVSEKLETRENGRSIDVDVSVTADIAPGVCSLPHGWGHDQPGTRLSVAAQRPGANLNAILDDSIRDPLSGNAVLGGIAVELAPL